MSDPQQDPAPEPKKDKKSDTLYFFPIGLALMVTGLSLTITLGWSGIALLFSGLTFVILSLPAVKEHLAKRKAEQGDGRP